jgi:hypothetical protein
LTGEFPQRSAQPLQRRHGPLPVDQDQPRAYRPPDRRPDMAATLIIASAKTLGVFALSFPLLITASSAGSLFGAYFRQYT